MEAHMTTISLTKEKISTNPFLNLLLKGLAGCLFITVCSFIKIPFYPVSFTMQTFAICLLGFSMSRNESALSAVLYLILGTLGLPVLCGNIAPYWFMGSLAGYYIAMPIACYLIGSIKSKTALAPVLSTLLILGLGSLVLSLFIGLKSALLFGFLLFLPTDLLKAFGAAILAKKLSKRF